MCVGVVNVIDELTIYSGVRETYKMLQSNIVSQERLLIHCLKTFSLFSGVVYKGNQF